MHLAYFIHWDPDPSIFGLPFRWYGLLFASSFFFGYILMSRWFKREGVPDKWLESLTIYMALSTVIGARLGHCLFYDPQHYLSNPIEILKIWEGGLASHGAAIGIITGLALWTRFVSHRNVLWILDRIVITVALSGLTIRAGNLMNSEILGKETTSAIGFVFPRADQGEAIRAKWDGDQVELAYHPVGMPIERSFDFYRSTDDSIYHLLPVEPVRVPAGELREDLAAKVRDTAPGTKGHLHYMSAEHSAKAPLVAENADSLHPRKAYFEDPFPADKVGFAGRWEGDKVHLRFDMRGLVNANSSHGTVLLRGDGKGEWTVIHRGVLSGNPSMLVLDTLDTPGALAEPHYRLVIKEDESLLVARHPAQIYEAVAYTIIFLFLWWYYDRLDAKVPLGRLFGMFLVLVFGMRILIEFAKEEQAAFMEGGVLNMGQLLSVPFVLAGAYFIVQSFRNPKFPGPVAAEEPSKRPVEK
ncbi:MAG: prolipoprotein diacylglyceryl transferase [Bacteroidia bacterium]